MLAQFQSGPNLTSLSGDSAVPGYSGCHTEPPSLRTPFCTKSRTGLWFREGEEDPVPHESRLAQDRSRSSVGKTAESSRDPPVEDTDSPQGQGSQHDPGFSSVGQSGADYAYHDDDEEDDDKESVADLPPLDKTYARLVNFIHNRFPHSQPFKAALVPPRCEFKDFFSIDDPAPSTKQNLKVYPRVAELVSVSADRASRLARESRALHRVVPLKRKMFYVVTNQITAPRVILILIFLVFLRLRIFLKLVLLLLLLRIWRNLIGARAQFSPEIPMFLVTFVSVSPT